MELPARFGVISDLHSNFEALKVAVNWLAKQGIDQIICLGDIIGYNANPCEVTYLAHKRCTFSLKGNHERYVLGEPARGVKEEKLEVIHWTRDQLSELPNYIDWLRSLPDYHLYKDTFLLCHGSPRDPDEYIFRKDVIKGSLRHMGEYYPSIRICFYGHSHLPMLVTQGRLEAKFSETRTIELERDSTYLINPGSVGQPRDGVPKTAFGVMDVEKWAFTWVRLPYDHETTARRIREAGLDATLATRLARGK